MLRVDGLQASYGRSQILFDVRLAVGRARWSRCSAATAWVRPRRSAAYGIDAAARREIEFGNTPVTGWPPEAIARRGVGLVPEGRQIFPLLTVEENLVATAANRLGWQSPGRWPTCIGSFRG